MNDCKHERELYRIDAERVEHWERCDGCDDGSGDGTPAAAEVSVGPLWRIRRITLCQGCMVRLRATINFALKHYTDLYKIGEVPRDE